MNYIQLTLDGRLLKRGFWIYVWKIHTMDSRELYYVGRTGDSSSNNAASPFSRMSAHLNPKGKGNSLYRNLLAYDVNHETSLFKLFAHGPIFDEQDTFEDHKIFRDKVAVIEKEVAVLLIQERYNVIGSHSAPRKADESETALAKLLVEKIKIL